MKKVKNLLLAFAIVGLFVSVSTTKVEAQCPSTPMNECVDCCKHDCYAGPEKHLDCSGLTGESKRDCTTLNNLFTRCCYFRCADEFCGIDAGESIACEALEGCI